MTCLPGGTIARIGRRLHEALQHRRARRAVRAGVVVARPAGSRRRARCGSSRGGAAGRCVPGRAVKLGGSRSARLSLKATPLERQARARASSASGTSAASSRRRKSDFGSALTRIARASTAPPSRSSSRAARPSRSAIRSTGAPVRSSAPGGARRGGERARDRAHPAPHEAPGALRAHRPAGVVVGQHVGGAGIARAGLGADQPVGGQRRGQHRRAHVALDELGRGAAQRGLHVVGKLLERRLGVVERVGQQPAQARRLALERRETGDVARIERGDLARVGRLVEPEQQRAAVGQRRERGRVLA